ncbi:tetratricopeptide repeat protein [Neoroseomonas soli]|uniref:Tetratricopeptide repeat protein n=1 Tax=Neoroseomonas soli TaxID=1081025 RepID=A0A9X9X1S3_9PROT|nr:tetratricopeptide repeat protein [Neoroseomonas soli]MBR0673352.1 tetratricopeptide repeat protein [Neoroseomonas soli]
MTPSGLWRLILTAVPLVLFPGAVAETPLRAGMQRLCAGTDSEFPRVAQIAGCDWIIQSPETSPPHLAIAFYNRGVSRRAAGDTDGAIADYGEAIRVNPNYASAFTNRGNARRDQHDLAGAIADYTEALRINPFSASSLTNRGNARREQGDLPGAIEDHGAAIKAQPSFALAWRNRGLAHHDLGDLKAALADFDEAIRLDPSYALGFHNRALARRANGDPQGAVEDYDALLRLRPRHAQAFHERGLARGDLGDLAGAVADQDTAIRLDRRIAAAALTARGLARIARGQAEAAMPDLLAAFSMTPKDAQPLAGLCLARHRMQRRGATAGECTLATAAARPREGWPHAVRGGIALASGDLGTAAADLAEALQREPTLATALFLRAILRQWEGNEAGAAADAATARQSRPRIGEQVSELFGPDLVLN